MDISVALVPTARHGYMWEVLAYDELGNEVGGRFDNELEARNFAVQLNDREEV